MVMFLFFGRFELVTALPVAQGKFGNKAHPGQQFKCAVDSGQSHSRVRFAEGSIDFFGTNVF